MSNHQSTVAVALIAITLPFANVLGPIYQQQMTRCLLSSSRLFLVVARKVDIPKYVTLSNLTCHTAKNFVYFAIRFFGHILKLL